MLSSILLLASAPLLHAQQPAALPLNETTRRSEPTRFVLKTLDWDARNGQPVLPAALAFSRSESLAAGYYLVHAGDADQWQAMRELILARGGKVFDYLPHNGMEAWLPAGAVAGVGANALAVVPVHPGLKIDPEMGRYQTAAADPLGRMLISVEFWPDVDLEAAEQAIRAMDVQIEETAESGRYLRATVRANSGQVIALARQSGVKYMQESATAEQRNDKSQWVVQTYVNNDRKLWNQGLMGDGVYVGHIDGKIQESSCYFDDPTGAAVGSTHRKIKWWNPVGGADSHGTHTAGSAAGNSQPVNGATTYNGLAPNAFLVHNSSWPSSTQMLSFLNTSHSHGARVHTNSWGNDWTTAYDYWSRDIDAYSHDNEDGMVAFAVTNGSSLKNPENAKNVLAVAATSRTNPESKGTGGAGPTADGRLKPEVWAPGCSTYSASTATCGVTTMCGTSMACPVVVGSSALLKQYFQDGYYPSGSPSAADAFTPSGALLRACLISCAVNMTGISGYTGNQEGYGRILLDNVAFLNGDSELVRVVDVPHTQGISHGQNRTLKATLPAGKSELRLTLVWSDEPGAAFSSAPTVNDLNLQARAPNGTIYHGNIRSTSNGLATPNPTTQDAKNTVEQIIIANPPGGTWYFRIEGKDVPVGPQGYAGVLQLR
ncbi:MAG: S8 family serine peptidase [Planctomycetes bacterium]|nr:S8 family serine peptidase [Planctomycetota bacterium]